MRRRLEGPKTCCWIAEEVVAGLASDTGRLLVARQTERGCARWECPIRGCGQLRARARLRRWVWQGSRGRAGLARDRVQAPTLVTGPTPWLLLHGSRPGPAETAPQLLTSSPFFPRPQRVHTRRHARDRQGKLPMQCGESWGCVGPGPGHHPTTVLRLPPPTQFCRRPALRAQWGQHSIHFLRTGHPSGAPPASSSPPPGHGSR